MPLPPNIPHIVGDDDLDENAPILQNNQPEPSVSSSSNSSSDYDGDVSTYDAYSSDGIDWSMNVTHIIAPPGSIQIFAGADSTSEMDVAVDLRVPSQILANADDDDDAAMPQMEVEEIEEPMPEMEAEVIEEPTLFSILNLVPIRQVTSNEVDMAAGVPEAQVAAGGPEEQVATRDPEAQVAASAAPMDEPPPKQAKWQKPTRTVRNLRSNATMAEQEECVGRLTRSTSLLPLARPVDMTAYFQEISANLVSKRVALASYLLLRDQIDRLILQIFDDPSFVPKRGRSTD